MTWVRPPPALFLSFLSLGFAVYGEKAFFTSSKRNNNNNNDTHNIRLTNATHAGSAPLVSYAGPRTEAEAARLCGLEGEYGGEGQGRGQGQRAAL